MRRLIRSFLRWLLRRLVEAVVRFCYPRRSVTGRQNVPPDGRVIFVSNHPNGLLDPLLLEQAVGRPVSFLAKHTMFANPVGNLAMETFGAIPIFRSQDDAGPARERAQKNERTFALCREALAQGRWLALFPEGMSHSASRLLPLKSGAARIALSAEETHQEAHGAALGVLLVPVGLRYVEKTKLRSSVAIAIGRPVNVAARMTHHREAGASLVDGLTADIRAALEGLLLEAESEELLRGASHLAAWTAATPAEARDPAYLLARTQRLLAAYERLQRDAPERVARVVRSARAYARVLRRLGIRDPWRLEAERIRPAKLLAAVLRLLGLLPLGAVGALLGWLPYRLAGKVAYRIVKGESDLLTTVKILAGALFLLLAWIAETVAIGSALRLGPWSLALFLAGPIGGYAALRCEETLGALRGGWWRLWLRAAHGPVVTRLRARRLALGREVEAALDAG